MAREIWQEPPRGGYPPPSFWSLPGLELFRAAARRHIPSPPLYRLVGLRLTQSGIGTATVTMPATGWLTTTFGLLLDSIVVERALNNAVRTGLGPAMDAEIEGMSVAHLRPVTPECGTIIARARTIDLGRRSALAIADVEDVHGRLLAHASGRVLIRAMDPPPPSPPPPLEPVEEPAYPTPDPYLRPVEGFMPPDLFADRDGLSVARGIVAGELGRAPSFRLTGYRLVEAEEGRTRSTMPITEWLCDSQRRVSAGALAMMMTMGIGFAIRTTLGPGQALMPSNFSTNYFRSPPPDGREVVLEAGVVHRDDQRTVATGELLDADGRRIALGTLVGIVEGVPRTARRQLAEEDRFLATVMSSDIAGSTERVAVLGDKKWRALLDRYHAEARRAIELERGRVVKTLGDGVLATFDTPARAVRAAQAIVEAAASLELPTRTGIHTGECEWVAGDLAGIAVHICDRVAGLAAPGAILVTATVRDLAAGSGIEFVDRGLNALKGIPDEWRLFEVPSSSRAQLAPAEAGSSFIREGEYWTVNHESRVIRVKDSKGLRYIVTLLREPGREVHVLDLVGGGAADTGDAGALLDDAAKAAFRSRFRELEAEITEAESFGDGERAARVRSELDAITERLAAGVGLAGRDRKAASAAERARLSVTRAIKTALTRITQADPALGKHLANAIRTGTFCAYAPDRPVSWRV